MRRHVPPHSGLQLCKAEDFPRRGLAGEFPPPHDFRCLVRHLLRGLFVFISARAPAFAVPIEPAVEFAGMSEVFGVPKGEKGGQGFTGAYVITSIPSTACNKGFV